MKGYTSISLIVLALFASAFSLCGKNIVWNNTAGGNWSASANWTPHQVPGSSDIAVITSSGNYSVTLDINASVGGLLLGATDGSTQTLSINGQTFSLDGQATVNSGGQFNLSSGTFKGVTNNGGAIFTGTLTPLGGALAGKFTLTSNSILNLATFSAPNTLSNLTLLTNYGTVNWSNVDLYGAPGLQIFNKGLWNAETDNALFGNGAVFNNSGVFRKSAGTVTNATTLDTNTAFNSTGTVDVQRGTLAVQNGSCSGVFNAASGSMINLGSSPTLVTLTLTGSIVFAGSGTIEGRLINGDNALLGGTANFSAANLFGTMTISSNAVMNLVGNIGSNTFGGTLNNYGTVNWSNVDLYCVSSPTPTFYNYGSWNTTGHNSFHGSSLVNNHFFNSGTFRKLFDNGTATLDGNLAFVNSGLVDVENGTLAMSGGYAPDTGSFNIASNAIIDFSGSVYGYTSYGGTSFTGNGTINGNLTGGSGGSNIISSGSITLQNSTLFGPLTVASNAVLNLVGNIYFQYLVLNNYGTVVWDNTDLVDVPGYGSQINNYGLWNATADNTFHGSGSVFNNYGTFRKSGGDPNNYPGETRLDNGVAFNNTGTVDVQAGLLVLSTGNGSGLFNTANDGAVFFDSIYCLTGSLNFTGTGLIVGFPVFQNAVLSGTLRSPSDGLSGTLTVASNTVLDLTAYSGTLGLNSLILTNYGTVTWSNADLTASANTQIYNYGLWNAVTDNNFQGGGSVFNNYGTFRDSSSNFVYLDYGVTFNNSGTIDVQSGTLEMDGPGLGSGTFNTASSTTLYLSPNYSLIGNPTFTGYGQMAGFLVGNNAVLHGTLAISGAGFSGTLTVASNTVVNLVPGSGLITFGFSSPTILTNYGVINWGNTDLYSQNNPEIDNYGLWNAQTDNTFTGNGSSVVFNNYGILRKSGGTGTTLIDYYTTFNTPGTIDIQSGTLEMDGPGLGSGTFNTASSTTLHLSPYYFLIGNPTFTGYGQVAGFLVGNNAVLHGTLTSSGIVFSGTLTVASNTVVNLLLGSDLTTFGFSSPTILTNYGVINWGNTDLYSQNNPEIDNYGQWNASGNNTFYGNGTVFNNYGTLRDSSSNFVDLDAGVTFNNPGTVDVQSGLLEMDGPCLLTGGTLNFGITGSNSFGSITLAGNAALTGTLSVNLNNGYSPAGNNSFTLLSYGSETGTFASLELPHLSPAIHWQTVYGATTFTLSVTSAPPVQLTSTAGQNGGNFSFSWNGMSGQTYQVQYTTNLAPVNWVNFGGAIPGVDGTMTVSNLIGLEPQRYYRLVISP